MRPKHLRRVLGIQKRGITIFVFLTVETLRLYYVGQDTLGM